MMCVLHQFRWPAKLSANKNVFLKRKRRKGWVGAEGKHEKVVSNELLRIKLLPS